MVATHAAAPELLAHQDELLRFLVRRIRSRADAQDLLQATNVRVLARAPENAGRAWLFRVARSVLVDHHRREAARGREVLRRADLDGEPHAGIARALGTTANAVGVRLHRARKALRRRLEAHCGGCCSRDPLRCGCALARKDSLVDASPGTRAGRYAVPPTSSRGWT